MAFNLVEEIRKKSREEWAQFPREKVTEIRIWIQEHAEKAFLVGLISGVVLIAAFKIVLTIAILAVLCFVVVLAIAKPTGAPSSVSSSYSASSGSSPSSSAAEESKDRQGS